MKLIVGIDPGTTTGIALLDMNTESSFSSSFSKREMSIADICEYIAEKGEPVIIATDVKKPPATVRKIASTFGAVLFRPKRTISQSEKNSLVRLERKTKNKHEKDALAAAIIAKKRFSTLIRKIESALMRKDMIVFNDQVKEMLIRHKACNIEHAISLVRG